MKISNFPFAAIYVITILLCYARKTRRPNVWIFMNAHDPRISPLAHTLSGARTQAQASAPDEAMARGGVHLHDLHHFQIAQRYSRRIRLLKIGLPIIGTVLIMLFIAVAVVSQFLATPLGIATIDLTNGQVVMDRPSLNGFTASNSEYAIVADRALQDLDDPKKVILEKIAATLTLKDGNVVSVQSNQGKYNIDGENLQLSGGIKIHMSAGYNGELEDASIDVKSGTLSSDKQVFIKADIGDIRAEKLTVRDNGMYILFENRVHMTVKPEKLHARKAGQDR